MSVYLFKIFVEKFSLFFRTRCATRVLALCPVLAVDRQADWVLACCADPTTANGSDRSTTAAAPADHTAVVLATDPTAVTVSLLRRKVGFSQGSLKQEVASAMEPLLARVPIK